MLGLQASGRVHQHEVETLGLGGADRIEHHRRRIGIGRGIGHDRDPTAVAPDPHLLNGRGPKGVGSGDQAAVATAGGQVGQLAQGGGFADPIHPHQQPDVEPVALGGEQGTATGANRRLKQLLELVLKEANAFAGIHHLHIEALAQGPQGLVRGLDADIGAQQQGFQLVQRLRRERIVAQVGEQLGDEIAAGFLEAAAQPAEPIDFLEGHLVEAATLGRQHLS